MDVNDLFLKQLSEVSNDVRNVGGKLDVLDRRLTKIESDLCNFSQTADFQAKLYSQLDTRVSEAHQRLTKIETSPVMTVNSLFKNIVEKILLIITGGVALWIVTKMIPELVGK